MALNRSEIFKDAHRKARLIVINSRGSKYERTYAAAFAEALKFQYAKLRATAEREAERDAQNIGLPIRSVPGERHTRLFLRGKSIHQASL